VFFISKIELQSYSEREGLIKEIFKETNVTRNKGRNALTLRQKQLCRP
jgi:hypothetical protein